MQLQDYFNSNALSALAILAIPPQGEDALISFNVPKTCDPSLTLTGSLIDPKTWWGMVTDSLPAIEISASDQDDGAVLITATASRDLTGLEIYWENTAGTLDRNRSVFSGNVALVHLRKPISTDKYKVKLNYKYFSGVAEIVFNA